MAVIWIKTDAGRAEMQSRALVKERAQRTLLLLIDGVKPDELLLASVAGTQPDDFNTLQALGLIMPAQGGPRGALTRGASTAPAPLDILVDSTPAAPTAPMPLEPADAIDYPKFTATLTQLISKELGLRGFTLTLAVEKAGTIQELQAVAQRTLDQIRDRKGEATAAAARRALYGG
jgi:hypothetical protein